MGMKWVGDQETGKATRDWGLLIFPDSSMLRVFKLPGTKITIGPNSSSRRLRYIGTNRPDSFIITTDDSSICVGHGFACRYVRGYMRDPFDPTPLQDVTITIGEPLEIPGIDLPGNVLSVTCRPEAGDERYAETAGSSSNGPNPLDRYFEFCRTIHNLYGSPRV